LDIDQKPDLSRLKFVQIDEFYPMDPSQHNSFFNYVNNFYLSGFGISRENALLINCAEIPWQFLGLSMAGWSFIWFTLFLVLSILIVLKSKSSNS